MSLLGVVIGYALRESLRRRVFLVVVILTLVFLVLYGLGAWASFDGVGEYGEDESEEREEVGTALLGFAMLVTLFLSAVLAIFLTIGAVSGDADRGILQPLVVRPIGRARLLLGRFAAAVLVSGAYAVAFYAGVMLITAAVGSWFPDQPVVPAIALFAAMAVIAALSILGSVFLSATANGIALFMLFGAGLMATVLREIGAGLDVDVVKAVADLIAWALPFVVLYLASIEVLSTSEVGNVLGAFGSDPSPVLVTLWTVAYVAGAWLLARAGFARRDL